MTARARKIVSDDDLYRRFAKGHINPANGTIYFSALLRNPPGDAKKKEADPQLSVYLADTGSG